MVNDLAWTAERTWEVDWTTLFQEHGHFWYLKAFSRKQMFINISWMSQKKKKKSGPKEDSLLPQKMMIPWTEDKNSIGSTYVIF